MPSQSTHQVLSDNKKDTPHHKGAVFLWISIFTQVRNQVDCGSETNRNRYGLRAAGT